MPDSARIEKSQQPDLQTSLTGRSWLVSPWAINGIPLIILGLLLFMIGVAWSVYTDWEGQLLQEPAMVTIRDVNQSLDVAFRSRIRHATMTAPNLYDEESARLDREEFDRRAASLMRAFPGALALNWVNTNYTIEHVYPMNEENRNALGKYLGENPRAKDVIKSSRDAREPKSTGILELYQGGRGFAFYVPVVSRTTNQVVGYFNFAFRGDEMLEAFLRDQHLDDFIVRFGQEGHTFRYPSTASTEGLGDAIVATEKMQVLDQSWNLGVQIKPELVNSRRNALAPYYFGLGIFLALGISILIRQNFLSQSRVRRAGERIRRLVNDGYDAILLHKMGGEIVDANEQAEKLFLWSRQQLREMNIVDINAGEITPAELSEFFKSIKVGSPKTFNRVLKNQKGERLDVEVRVGAIAYDSGSYQYISIIRDISARKVAEDALKARERELSTLMANLPGMIYRLQVEPQRRLVYASRGSQELTGFDQGELREGNVNHYEELIHEEDFPKYVDAIRYSMLHDLPYMFEYRIRTRSGKEKWVMDKGTVVRDALGRLSYLEGFVSDITQQRLATAQLDELNESLERRVEERTQEAEAARRDAESANVAKSDFLSSMSHEIRTPLHAMFGMLELLSFSELSEDQANTVQSIRESGASLLRIVDDILDLSKIEAGMLELRYEPISLQSLVESVAELVAETARAKGVIVECFVDQEIPYRVRADALRLQQVLFNIVGNAVKFTSQGRVVLKTDMLATQDGRASIRFLVSDTGIGVDRESLGSLFEPFSQAESTTTRRFGGTGLGLSICKQLVGMMGGSILVCSELEEGSTFAVYMSLEVGEQARPETTLLEGTRVALITDDDDVAHYYGDYLRNYGAFVERCHDSPNAPQCIEKQGPFDVLFISARTGEERLELLRKACGGLEEPEGYAACVSYSRTEEEAHWPSHSRRKGDAVLMAPVRRSGLVNAVSLALGRSARVDKSTDSDREKANLAQLQIGTYKKILVAEDNATNRDLLQRQLEMLGVHADFAIDGEEALSLWVENDYGLLLTDLHMPVMDGYELATRIRANEAEHNVQTKPIIAFTANALAGEMDHCMELGMNDYLAKPVELSRLRACMKQWLVQAAQDSAIFRVEEVEAHERQLAEQREALAKVSNPADLDYLKSFYKGRDESLNRMLLRFLKTSGEADQLMRTFDLSENLDQIGFNAHKLKSAAATVGANPLREICAKIEAVAKGDNESDDLTLLLESYYEELERVRDYIEEVAEKLADSFAESG